MSLSVLIVSYNARDRLRNCLASLTEAFEVVVVDNASPDESAAMVRDEFPEVRLVAWPKNRGFSAGVNEAARIASGDCLLLLNPDTVVPRGALLALERALAARPKAGALGCRQVDEWGRLQLTIGPRPSFVMELLRRAVQRRLDAGSAWVAAMLDRVLAKPRRVPWVAGSALVVRRREFAAVGGFDEGFFLYFEDIDFCLRLGRLGLMVYYDPSITLTHIRGASAETSPKIARRAYRESQLRYWQKHRGRLALGVVRAYQRLCHPA